MHDGKYTFIQTYLHTVKFLGCISGASLVAEAPQDGATRHGLYSSRDPVRDDHLGVSCLRYVLPRNAYLCHLQQREVACTGSACAVQLCEADRSGN